MMETLRLLWQHCPGELAACSAIAMASAALMALLIAAIMWPTESDEMMEDAR